MFYQIYLTNLAAEWEYILTLKKEVGAQIPEFLVFGSDALWTSTILFTNAMNDIMIIFNFKSAYQNILEGNLSSMMLYANWNWFTFSSILYLLFEIDESEINTTLFILLLNI